MSNLGIPTYTVGIPWVLHAWECTQCASRSDNMDRELASYLLETALFFAHLVRVE
jgi:hypothetical protein